MPDSLRKKRSQPPGGRNARARTEPPRLPAFIYGVVQDERAKPVARARIWLREGTIHHFTFARWTRHQGRFNMTLLNRRP